MGSKEIRMALFQDEATLKGSERVHVFTRLSNNLVLMWLSELNYQNVFQKR